MRSIHGVGELMTQVVLRGGGFLPMTPMAAAPEGNVKQAEPEKEDIMVMDTKLKIIEILQVSTSWSWGREGVTGALFRSSPSVLMEPKAFWEENGSKFLAHPSMLFMNWFLLFGGPEVPRSATASCVPGKLVV